jgi:hypothetical protein
MGSASSKTLIAGYAAAESWAFENSLQQRPVVYCRFPENFPEDQR